MYMGRYVSGDVVLAPVRIGGLGDWKVRPVVVVSEKDKGNLLICPVSSSPSTDTPSLPLSLDAFARGGLDLFTESYALVAHAAIIRTADVIGKKGTLLPETLSIIQEAVSMMRPPQEKRSRRPR